MGFDMRSKPVYFIKLFIPFCIILLLLLLHSVFENLQKDFNYWLSRKNVTNKISTPVYIVYFDETDITQMGGWPLSRNIYGFLAEKLIEMGARVVGFHVFWEDQFEPNDENNLFLSHILSKHKNIVASYYFKDSPGTFQNFPINAWKNRITSKNIRVAKGINTPDDLLLTGHAQFGFVNLYTNRDGIVEVTDLLMAYSDSCYPSFANVIAGNFADVPVDSGKTQIKINYTFDGNHLPVISVRDIFHVPMKDSIRTKLDGAIILVGIISPHFGFYKRTPVDSNVPVIAIQAQIVDNLVSGTYLKDVPLWLFLLVFTCLTVFLYKSHNKLYLQIIVCATLAILFSIAAFIFWHFQFIFQLYLYLTAVFILSFLLVMKTVFRNKKRYTQELNSKKQLEQKFSEKLQSAARLEQDYITLREKYNREIKVTLDELAVVPKDRIGHLRKKYPDIITSCNSPMMEVLAQMELISKTDEPVLLTGESGTGKELVAKAIHKHSKRSTFPFIAINCSALSESLLESELFGYKKGAFTGANQDKTGFFEAAHDGTIFLDEISETSLSFQAKLLRVLQESSFYRVGSTSDTKVNVRLIAATNKDLNRLVDNGLFRNDLYYRLNVLPLHLLPLRERQEDIQPLINHFLTGRKLDFSQGAINALKSHFWPGNIRELQNICTRMKLLQDESIINTVWVEKQIKSDKEIAVTPLEEKILALYREFDFCNDANTKIAQELIQLHRSTITEYLKGMTFQFFFEEKYHLDNAIKRFNPDRRQLDSRVRNKMLTYLRNLCFRLDSNLPIQQNMDNLKPHLKKLPGKYHDAAIDNANAFLKGLWHIPD